MLVIPLIQQVLVQYLFTKLHLSYLKMQKKQQAEAEQETIKVQNQTKILEAQADAQAKQIAAEAEAKANSTISASLTDKLLKKMEMEAREKHGWVTVQGGTVVTDTK